MKLFLKIWKDSVGGNIISVILIYLVTQLFNLTSWYLNDTRFFSKYIEFKGFIQETFHVSFWFILIILSGFILIFIKTFRKFVFFIVSLLQSNSTKGSNYQAFTRSVINKAHSGTNISIDSKFLGAPNGVFSIWAYVSNSHNERTSYYKFIVSYNSIGEKKIDPSKYESYPDTWAILRETPSKQDDYGKWKFVCRNVIDKLTSIESAEPLTNGWHLFTVAWSKKSNYIKFIIDTYIVGETKFINWPTEFSQNIRIGRISRDNIFSYFNSRIEPSRFTPDEYKKKYVNEFFRKQPSE